MTLREKAAWFALDKHDGQFTDDLEKLLDEVRNDALEEASIYLQLNANNMTNMASIVVADATKAAGKQLLTLKH